ncbi:MAG: hypothetical protein HXY30_10740, partial [Pseudorhodoplanes sp.]|nr:hypothetical protein [Pseudorhodoplanes sp.]
GWTTGWVACAVGWSTFILPFLFVLTPSLLMDGSWPEIIVNLVRVLFGIFLGTVGAVGFSTRIIPVPSRLLYGALSLAVVLPLEAFAHAIYVNLAGTALAVLLLAFDYARRRTSPAPARP